MAAVIEMAFVSAQVPKDLLDEVTELAKKNDRPRSSEIRQALKDHVEAAKRRSVA